MKRDILLLFNLELDLDSRVLASGHDWVNEFSQQVSQTKVFSTHVGRYVLEKNVSVREIGGGSFKNRMMAILVLLSQIPFIVRYRNRLIVFHHMSPRTVIVLGWVIRAAGIPQGLWYSHSHASRELKLASYIVNLIFSTSPTTLPIKSGNAIYVGHGIQTKMFTKWRKVNQARDKKVISVGRLVPIKRFEVGIKELGKSNSPEKKFEIFGPGSRASEYVSHLESISTIHGVNLILRGDLPYDAIPEVLATSKFFVSGTPKSVDKAALEAALSGCFIVSDNSETLEMSGMNFVLDQIKYSANAEEISIIDFLNELPPHKADSLRLEISKIAESRHDISKLAVRVIEELRGLE